MVISSLLESAHSGPFYQSVGEFRNNIALCCFKWFTGISTNDEDVIIFWNCCVIINSVTEWPIRIALPKTKKTKAFTLSGSHFNFLPPLPTEILDGDPSYIYFQILILPQQMVDLGSLRPWRTDAFVLSCPVVVRTHHRWNWKNQFGIHENKKWNVWKCDTWATCRDVALFVKCSPPATFPVVIIKA